MYIHHTTLKKEQGSNLPEEARNQITKMRRDYQANKWQKISQYDPILQILNLFHGT